MSVVVREIWNDDVILPTTRIELYFSSLQGTTLVKTVFAHKDQSGLSVSTRGKFPIHTNKHGSFQWTSAVKALCELFLKAKLHVDFHAFNSPDALNLNERLASNLYAVIRKRPMWMKDMFGIRSGNRLVVESVLKIAPASGICRLAAEWYESSGAVQVFLDLRLISDFTTLEAILKKITDQQVDSLINLGSDLALSHNKSRLTLNDIARLSSIPQSISRIITPDIECLSVNDSLASFCESLGANKSIQSFGLKGHRFTDLRAVYHKEIKTMLCDPQIFSSDGQKQRSRMILSNHTIRNYFDISRISREVPTIIPESIIDGPSMWTIPEEDPIPVLRDLGRLRLMVEPGQAPAIIIMMYLKYFCGLDIAIDYSMPHSVALVKNMKANVVEPDLCFLTSAASFNILEKKEMPYLAVCFGPRISHATIQVESNQKRWHVGLMTETPGTASMVLSNLVNGSRPDFSSLKKEHLNPSDITMRLKARDCELIGIMAFPHYDLNLLQNENLKINELNDNNCRIDNLFFIHNKWFHLSKQFALAFRHAWLSLVENPNLTNLLIEFLINDTMYQQSTIRSCGVQFYD